MKRNILPLILTNKSSKTNLQKNLSKVNLDFSKINSFGKKFAQLKQDYINIKTMKKSISQNQYQEKLLNNDDENAKKNLYLEEAVYGADYIAKFKKIKLNLYKNRYIKKGRNNLFQNKLDQNNNNEKTPSLMFENDILLDDEKYLLEKNFYYNEIKPKNELNYDIEENNEVDSEDEIELEPERYRNKEIQSVEQSERTKKVNIRKNVLYLTELQNTKNPLEFPLPIKNKRSINDQININNIKQIKLSEDTQKYKNPFIFKKYSSLNNISHFHKIYRSFKNICRKHYAKGDSPSYAFIKSCEREKIVCNPLGLIKRWGDEGSLDINNQHTGDRYVNCLSSSLKYVKHINTLEMSKNNLTNVSMEKLFDNIKQNDNLVKNLLKLNLSFNNIKEKGISNIINFIEDKSCQLEDINLEGNNLGDNNINNLCMSISECLCNRLNTINLGKNKITKNSEQGLLALTSKCSELAVLILRNNQINNLLAYKIVLNLEKLYSLKMLDFSWNLIGDHLVYPILYEEAVNFHPSEKNLYNNFELDKIKTNMKILFNKNPLLPKITPNTKENNTETKNEQYIPEIKSVKVPERKPSPFAEEFSSYIKNNLCPLVHINISHNNLPYIDCELISKETKYNHNILGFHVDGNEMRINQLGFIFPIKQEQKSPNFYSKSQILYEAENFKNIPQVLSSPINKMRNSNNCWICECWNEVEFSFEISNKDIKSKYIVVKLHLDFENYLPCDMIYKKKRFKLVRMCPPGKVKYFFTVDGNPVYNCYKEFDYRIKEFEKPIKYTFNEEYIEQYNNIKFIGKDSDENTDNIFSINRNYLGNDIDIDIQEDKRDENNKLISKTIYVKNFGFREIKPNNNIITKEYKSTLKFSIPRPEETSSKISMQNLWKYSNSFWSYYNYNIEGESENILEKMLEADLDLAEYNLIFLNETEFIAAKQFLKDNYKKIINGYIKLSSYSGNNLWQITYDVLLEWIKNKCGDFLMGEYNEKKIEKILDKIYSNNKEIKLRSRYKKYFPNNSHNLIRHNFILFLVEASMDKYLYINHKIENHYEALKFSFENYFLKGFENNEYNIWRKDRYYNEDIDNYLKAFLPLIDGVFHTFSKKLSNEKNNKEIKMALEDFSNLIMSFISVEEFDMDEIPFIFHISKKFSINELSDDNFMYLKFEEFCEALCRIIDIYSPYPPEDDKDNWPFEKRNEQFLVDKLENIMPILYKKINHIKFNHIRDKFISPLKNQITSLYIIDYKNNSFYRGYESIFEQDTSLSNND